MGIEISGLGDDKQKAWARKCDSDNNGTLEGAEIEIFTMGNSSQYSSTRIINNTTSDGEVQKLEASKQHVVIGGVSLPAEDILQIKKNSDGMPRDYSVTLTSGISVHYDFQNSPNNASIDHGCDGSYYGFPPSKVHYMPRTDGNYTVKDSTKISTLKDGRGVVVTGSADNDFIEVHDSKIAKIDTGDGNDRVLITDFSGINGKDNIKEKTNAKLGTIHTADGSINWGFDK